VQKVINYLFARLKKNCEKQKYRKSFKKALSEYQNGHLEEASKILKHLVHRKVDDRTKRKIEKILLLLLVGEFYGMNTLNSLLSNYGVTSNDYQKLWSSLNCAYLVSMMNDWLWILFCEDFEKRIVQSGSTQSRKKLTIVLDGSIFKQWLKEEEFGKYFAKFYSGQYGHAVNGFNVLLCGMVIGEIFYPLHFQLRKKEEKDTVIALRILSKVHNKLLQAADRKAVKLPTLYFSVDSGFRSKDLVNYCGASNLTYIGVPKTSLLVKTNGKSLKIKELKKEYKTKEAAYYEKAASGSEPFMWRLRGRLNCLDKEVVLLFFRLNGSKKVSVIFCNNLDIKAKTLRRHWFERTKIELLFRLIKNNFKIQQTTVSNRLGFMKKLAFALVKSVYAQFFTQIVKKTAPKLRRLGFEGMRKRLIFSKIGREFLDELMENEDLLQGNKLTKD